MTTGEAAYKRWRQLNSYQGILPWEKLKSAQRAIWEAVASAAVTQAIANRAKKKFKE